MAVIPPTANADFVVAPPGSANQVGNAQSPGPFRFYGTGGSRNQTVYDASFFVAGGPVSIIGTRLRTQF